MAEVQNSSTHPPLPPTTEDDRLDWLRLLRSRRVGPATFWRLLEEFGSARAALAALPDVAFAAGVTDYQPCSETQAWAEVRAARAAGAISLCAGDADYPPGLLTADHPIPFLWTRGDRSLLQRPMVALVGARNASSLGLRMARALAAGLSEAGIVVVSGLARGIDAEAHLTALPGGTVAVMAGGVDVIYPAEHTALAARIATGGLLLSDQPMGLVPQARHFPLRNDIIAGLSQAVVVVEAAAKSGSLITARAALDLGRDVFAVPGHPLDARAGGCNILIRDGATLIRDAADVLAALGVEGRRPPVSDSADKGPRVPAASATVLHLDAARRRQTGGDARIMPGRPPDAAGRGPEDRPPAGPNGRTAAESGHGLPDSAGPRAGLQAASQPRRPDQAPGPPAAAGDARVADPAGVGASADRPSDGAEDAPALRPPTRSPLRDVAELHRRILDRLGPSPLAEDQLIRDLAAPAQWVAPALLDLEMDGRIERQPGGLLVRLN